MYGLPSSTVKSPVRTNIDARPREYDQADEDNLREVTSKSSWIQHRSGALMEQ